MAKQVHTPDDPENLNPAKRAAEDLSALAGDYSDDDSEITVVDENLRTQTAARKAAKQKKQAATAATADSATERSAAPVVQSNTARNRARILLLTQDANILTKGSLAERHVLELAGMFAEVHVILLSDERTTGKKEGENIRLGEYVWIYTTNSKSWWRSIFDARKVARKQLIFANGFRPDLIIADDPFEAGMAGLGIAKKQKRSLQIHITEDFLDSGFRARAKHNWIRRHMAAHVLKRVQCVRTKSTYLAQRIQESFKSLTSEQVAALPVFYDLAGWQDTKATVDLRQQYPQFRFLLVHVSSMNALAHTDTLIDGIFYLLRQYPTIGLLIVGDGPDREALQQRVTEYALESQIIFLPATTDVVSCVKTADVLVHTSEDAADNEPILQAAAVGTPAICTSSGLAAELLIDEESVLLCPADSPPCFGEKINRLLNDNPLRDRLALNARSVVETNIEQDYQAYLALYRQSIERCIATEVAPAQQVAQKPDMHMPE